MRKEFVLEHFRFFEFLDFLNFEIETRIQKLKKLEMLKKKFRFHLKREKYQNFHLKLKKN